MLISSALVFIMIPALSLIYAGTGKRSFALTLFRLPLITGAFIGLQVSLPIHGQSIQLLLNM
jgi:Amt family ammonium transporter